MYFIISNVEAQEKTVRVLDVMGGAYRDITVVDLIALISDNVLPIENATVVNGELQMINGGLERYGLVVYTENGEEIDPVAVVVSEVVDDNNNNIILGYRLANCDGQIYDYSIEDVQSLFADYTLANGEVYKDDKGVYWLKQPSKPYPIITLSALNGKKTLELDNGNEPVDDDGVEEIKKVTPVVLAHDIVIGEDTLNEDKKDNITPIAEDISLSDIDTYDKNVESKTEDKMDIALISEDVADNAESVAESEKSVEPIESDIPVEPFTVPYNKVETRLVWVIELVNGDKVSGDCEIFENTGVRGIKQNGASVTRDAEYQGIEDTTVRRIIIPDDIGVIGTRVFENFKALEVIEFGVNLKTFGERAFANCSNLRHISGHPVKIGREAFVECEKLADIYLNDVTTVGAAAFTGCKALRVINLENAVTIGNNAFSLSGVQCVRFGDALSNIGAFVFFNCIDLEKAEFVDYTSTSEIFTNGYEGFLTWLRVRDNSMLKTIPAVGLFYKCGKLIDVNIDEKDIVKYREYLLKGTAV